MIQPESGSRILLTGASGYIGGRLAPRLLERGYRVRCLTRSAAKLEARPWARHPGVEIVVGGADDSQALHAAMEGCVAAYYFIHSMMTTGAAFRDADRRIARGFAEAAREAGVGRIVYLGGLGETGDDLSEHLASRREVEVDLASAGVPVTTFRAAMIIGSGSASFEILRYLVERLPVMITPRWLKSRCQPIAVRNVLHYLTECLAVPETTGETYDIGGSNVATYCELIHVMAEERGIPRRIIIGVPVLTPRLSSYWIHLVTPLSHRIARPLTEGLKNDVVCRDERIKTLIPQELLSIRESIRRALALREAGDAETSWSDAGVIPGDPEWAGGTVLQDVRQRELAAPPERAFEAVCGIGGEQGYYCADWLWALRGFLDRMIGGPGLRRGRRSANELHFGDAVDFWRVTYVERPRALVLRAEMKLPGIATLEFQVEPGPQPGRSILTQKARFQPRGLFGLLYWYAVAPFHRFVFPGLLRGLGRRAEQLARDEIDAPRAVQPTDD